VDAKEDITLYANLFDDEEDIASQPAFDFNNQPRSETGDQEGGRTEEEDSDAEESEGGEDGGDGSQTRPDSGTRST
ncbi:hypothetical protein FRC12_005887, partial [Ceratobasidium sp. 428]